MCHLLEQPFNDKNQKYADDVLLRLKTDSLQIENISIIASSSKNLSWENWNFYNRKKFSKNLQEVQCQISSCLSSHAFQVLIIFHYFFYVHFIYFELILEGIQNRNSRFCHSVSYMKAELEVSMKVTMWLWFRMLVIMK